MSRKALVLACLLVACGGPPRHPMVTPGAVIVDGAVTFRTRAGGEIEVTTRRGFRDRVATGSVTVRGMQVDAARRSPLVRIAVGRAWLAVQSQFADDPRSAYAAAHQGITELGTEYRRTGGARHIIDDTGHAVRIASIHAENGDHARASAHLRIVLQERIGLYLRAFAGSME